MMAAGGPDAAVARDPVLGALVFLSGCCQLPSGVIQDLTTSSRRHGSLPGETSHYWT